MGHRGFDKSFKVKDYIHKRLEKRPLYFVLIDPEKPEIVNHITNDIPIDAILVGGSSDESININNVVKEIKIRTNVPTIIFPGTYRQITPLCDAILFMSLISGRNPRYLIEEQIKGAPFVKKYGIEPLPTAYILIDGGRETSVVKKSHTQPLSNKEEIVNHALAGIYLGMEFVYLEAGSGALNHVSGDIIKSVKETIEDNILIVGGGIRTIEDAQDCLYNGADIIVTGTLVEDDPSKIMEMGSFIWEWRK